MRQLWNILNIIFGKNNFNPIILNIILKVIECKYNLIKKLDLIYNIIFKLNYALNTNNFFKVKSPKFFYKFLFLIYFYNYFILQN